MSTAINNANHDYQQGRPGFYVVNHETDLAVAGPFRQEADAANAKATADAPYLGMAPDALWIYEVTWMYTVTVP